MPLKLVAIIKKSMIPPICFLTMAGIVYYFQYGPIDVISNPHRLKINAFT